MSNIDPARTNVKQSHTSRPVRVAVYRRVAAPDNGGDSVLRAQRAILDEFIKDRGWVLVEDYVEVASGAHLKSRQELTRLMADASTGKFDLVLVSTLDRLARKVQDLLHIVQVLDGCDVGLLCLTEGLDTRTVIGKAVLGVYGAIDGRERELLLERLRSGMASRGRGTPRQ